MKICSFMFAEKAYFPIIFMCTFFKIPTSTYYDWRAGIERREIEAHAEAVIVEQIKAVHAESKGTYGSPRVTSALKKLGFCINHKRVEALMQKHDIAGVTPRRKVRTTIPADDVSTLPDLVKRDFDKEQSDVAWCGDITYIPTGEGWLYLATVMDLGSRRVLGFSMADHMRTSLVEAALRSAVGTRETEKMTGVIFHSDRGCQYTSGDFKTTTDELGILRSVGRTGVCWDNACAESFFATLKKELVNRIRFTTRAEARAAIFDYIEGWYNTRRMHSTLNNMSPIE
jgi:transposase InsO family protein